MSDLRVAKDGSKKKLSEYLSTGKPVVIDFYANF